MQIYPSAIYKLFSRKNPAISFLRALFVADITKIRGEIMSEILVVQSKVKEEIGKADMNCSGDLAEALSTVVEKKLARAIERAKANGRKTVRPEDL